MYIGKLNTKESSLTGSYRFMRRGTSKPYLPDKIFSDNGADEGVISFGTGSLCSGKPVGWKWDSLMDVGFDVEVHLSKECFVGAVSIVLADDSAVQSVEVFSEISGRLQCVGRFEAQTNGMLLGEFTIPVGIYAKDMIVRFNACFKDIVVEKLDIIGGIPDQYPVVYPSPAEAKYEEGKLCLNDIKSIVLSDKSEDLNFAANYLQERLLERFGIKLPIVEDGEKAIYLGCCQDIQKEGYKVSVKNDGVKLLASGRLGLLYAVETLVQLCSKGKIQTCEIEDYPYISIRGFHFGLPPREEIDFAKRLIRYVLIPMRYNMLIIEFAGGMRFDRHPEISQAWIEGNRAGKAGKQPLFPHGEMVAGGELLEKDEVRDFIEYARSFGFEIVPEVQSFGHVQYITYAHPEIAETAESVHDKKMDTRLADQPPSTFYHHSYCPLHEKSYEIIYDIIDEVVEAARPERYVHMGHDEIYQIGICPRCKGKDHAELYVKHVTSMYEYLKKKGYGMMIWADMLQPTERYLTHPAIAKIPKDIVLLDFIWYFHFDIDMEDHLLPHGFNVVMGNMYSSHYPRFESRIAKKGMIGAQVSTWCRFDEYTLAKKGKIFDLMYSAEMMWSNTYNSKAREVYTRMIQEMIPQVRDELRGIAKTVDTTIESTPIKLPISSDPCLPEEIHSLVCNAGESLKGYSFDLSAAQRLSDKPIEIEADGKRGEY